MYISEDAAAFFLEKERNGKTASGRNNVSFFLNRRLASTRPMGSPHAAAAAIGTGHVMRRLRMEEVKAYNGKRVRPRRSRLEKAFSHARSSKAAAAAAKECLFAPNQHDDDGKRP